MALQRYTRPVDGTIPVPALLYDDEELLASQENTGIYDGCVMIHNTASCVTVHPFFSLVFICIPFITSLNNAVRRKPQIIRLVQYMYQLTVCSISTTVIHSLARSQWTYYTSTERNTMRVCSSHPQRLLYTCLRVRRPINPPLCRPRIKKRRTYSRAGNVRYVGIGIRLG